MDPISKEITNFREHLRDFRQDPEARVLRVLTEPTQVGTLTKALRAEEWQPDNRCPFLVFDTAYPAKESPFEAMCTSLREHYALLCEGVAEENIELSELDVSLTGEEEPDLVFALHIQEFYSRIREHFDGLLVCWLPTRIDDKRGWQKSVTKLLNFPFEPFIRFVIADEDKKSLEKAFKNLDSAVITTTFSVDEKTVLEYFKKIMGSGGSEDKESPPSIAGAPAGAARPDVPPPPRLVGPRQPTEEEIRAAIEAGGQPVLTPGEGKRLRKLIFDAAVAIGEGRHDDAIQFQTMACDLCHEAGVHLEEVLMIMVLASYYQQAGQLIRTGEEYRRAAALAEETEAYPQVAQAYMALGYLYLMEKNYSPAAAEYEKAAEAAEKAEAAMLRIEALRMAGTCHLQIKDSDQAERCWRAALEAGETSTPDELRLSSFMDVATALIDLLKRRGLKEQARSVEQLIMEAGEKLRSGGEKVEEE
ncbi:MAG: hypothetical protein QME81_03505 [bacterium]|nr:hypothetical protein [bacterium]